jgi:hypothetical protein
MGVRRMAQQGDRSRRWAAAAGTALAVGSLAIGTLAWRPGSAGADSLSSRGFSLLLLSQGRMPITQVQLLLGSAGAMPADQRMKPVSEQFLAYRSASDLSRSISTLNSQAPAPAQERLLVSSRFPPPRCEQHGADTFCMAGGMAIPKVPFQMGRFLIAVDFQPDRATPDCRSYRPFFAGKGIYWNRHFRWHAYSAIDPTRSGSCRMVIFGGFPDAFRLSSDGNPEVGLFVVPRPGGDSSDSVTISQLP